MNALLQAQAKAQTKSSFTPTSIGLLQRKCACGNHAMGGECEGCSKKKRFGLQTKLRVNEPGDKYEQEADRIANQVMATSAHAISGVLPRIQRFAGQSNGQMNAAPASVDRALASLGRPLEPALRQDMEQRFGYDFSRVRVHTGAAAKQSALEVNAHAYTVGHNVVFGAGRFAPGTHQGQRLLAHELTHVAQQQGPAGSVSDTIRRSPCDNAAVRDEDRPTDIPRLENHPSTHGTACACLVFIHNDEENARHAAENLNRVCSYNLAIIQPGHGRNVAVPGQPEECDPNELFPEDIQNECTANPASCEEYVEEHDNLEAAQKQFFLAIRECSDGFHLPTVALHNNTIGDTRAIRDLGRDHRLAALMEDINRGTESGRGSRADLRSRLETVVEERAATRLLDRRGKTNIFRWCNASEIERCHIGNPWNPDHVIWTTNSVDYNMLAQYNVNVVLQGGSATASASETDLSTLFLRVGPDARYINIETPITPTGEEARRDNMRFILKNLRRLNLLCCDEPA